jgi:universal protein Kae1
MLILGLEGTAWNLSAGIVSDDEIIAVYESTYTPNEGGIHPREAAQHHAATIKDVVKGVFKLASEEGISSRDLDGIAFSQGPGMGPCLRTVATASRALSIKLGIPLLGVNHCIAHIEVGKWQCDLDDPVTLYVSGANAQVLAFRAGRYRIFGETLDIGIGNALDKFGRAVGLKHPGGPKIEELASRSKRYIPLPYVVKGMDFSFSGLTTAAIDASGSNSLEDVCYSLQETAFAMLTEVTERALAHCEKEGVLLVGGVGANRRLATMVETMCKGRGARFAVPEIKVLKDNGIMIAYTGLLQLSAGKILSIEASKVIPDYRPDEVDIVWMR